MKKKKQHFLDVWTGCLLSCSLVTAAQPQKKQFEIERAALLQRVCTIKNILCTNEHKKQESVDQLHAINTQIESNALLIRTIGQEIKTINNEIKQQQKAVERLVQDLAQLQKEYAEMVYVGYKTLNNIHVLIFVFAAPSFYRLVQRLWYVKQYVQIRKKHFQEIEKIRTSLQAQKIVTQQQLQVKNELLHKKHIEKERLAHFKKKKTLLIAKLAQQHTKLDQELQQRNKAVKRLNKLIQDIIRQEPPAPSISVPSKKSLPNPSPTPQGPPTYPLVPTHKNLTNAFRKNRGKLPWPVKTGFVSKKFGVFPHPVLRNVQVENLGIDIHTQEEAQVHAIFAGIIKAVTSVPGMHQVVIIQHGSYHSVYAKLQCTTVKVGQYVVAKTPIGTVYTDTKGTTELQLQLWQGTQKLNPVWWLSKK